jgi:hypothetical protein
LVEVAGRLTSLPQQDLSLTCLCVSDSSALSLEKVTFRYKQQDSRNIPSFGLLSHVTQYAEPLAEP